MGSWDGVITLENVYKYHMRVAGCCDAACFVASNSIRQGINDHVVSFFDISAAIFSWSGLCVSALPSWPTRSFEWPFQGTGSPRLVGEGSRRNPVLEIDTLETS